MVKFGFLVQSRNTTRWGQWDEYFDVLRPFRQLWYVLAHFDTRIWLEPNATLIEVLGSKDCLHRVARERVVPVAQAPLQHLHASLEV